MFGLILRRFMKKNKRIFAKIFHMKFNYWILTLLCTILLGLFSSCASRKNVVYFQNIDSETAMDSLYENNTIIKPNDFLNITVSAADPEAVRPYNLLTETRPLVGSFVNSSNSQQLGYLVDNNGNIEFPELGTIKVGGLSRKELIDYLTKRVSEGVKNAIVNVTILNFKVTVLGEVSRPSQYDVSGERITILEALGLAGDLTIFGRRDNILIIRETNGQNKYERVDITDADFINSEYYYLQQNDVVYVEPNGARVQGSTFNTNTGLYISVASLLLSVLVLIFR